MQEIETREDGRLTIELSPEEARKLKSILGQRANALQKPRVHREGNRIIIETGLDDYAIMGKGTPEEVHPVRVYQKAGSHSTNEFGEATDVIPAITVIEKREGGYCHWDASPVTVRDELLIIPKEHRQAALDWFDSKHPSGDKDGNKKEESTPIPPPVSEPEEEEELTLRDKVIIGVVKGVVGKELAKSLGCSEGAITYWKKAAIKEKILTKDGKKFTPMGLEKYEGIELNL